MKWEYIQRFALALRPELLNSYGQDEWELTAVLPTGSGYWMIFKRHVPHA